MAEQQQTEVTLLRAKTSGNATEAAGTRGAKARTVRRPAAPAPEEPATNQRDSDERLRQVLSVVLWLGAALLLLAIVSYTRLDQANTDIQFRDIFGLFSNDPVVAAKADTTQNWLGLLGALVADLLINGTIGYAIIALPLLVAFWGAALFVGAGYRRLARLTMYALLVLMLFASILGTAQQVSWMPHPEHEWSGAIGAFFASVLTGMLGTAGSFLVLVASMVIALVYATNSDLRTAFAATRRYILRVRDSIAARRGAFAAKTSADDAFALDAPAAAMPIQAPADNEPARMVRRMRGAAPAEEPRISRPAAASSEPAIEQPPRPVQPAPTTGVPSSPSTPHGNVSPRPVAAATVPSKSRDIPLPDIGSGEPTAQRSDASQSDVSRSNASVQVNDPLLTDAARRAAARSNVEASNAEGVEVVHGAPSSPPRELPSAVVNRLTLNVQDGETAADLETEDDGSLVERRRDEQIRYMPPSIDLLIPQSEDADVKDDELKENGRILQEKLATFNIQIENLTVTPGPVVTLYEFVPAAGIKLSQIESLTDDIALALKARGIRIIAPIPGKGTVGVEIPNHKPAMVRIRSVINTTKFREAVHRLPLALGKTTVGEVFCDDLAKMPHLLIAGATGSGKSVGVNAILTSLLYKMHPSDLKFVVIDPKKIELTQYRALRNHFLAKCPDIDEDIITVPQNAVIALKSLEMEMDRRYDILAKVGQRNIFDYNSKVAEGRYADAEDFHHVKLPYIVLILDELADLMITAAKEVEEPIARLAQLARAIGIHMIVATQRPSVDVLTGVIKANFPARIAYQVASKIDSRTILDMNGAEQLLGNGDMLYLPGGQPKPLRLQNAFISTEEVEEICEHIGRQKGYTYPYMLPSVVEKKGKGTASGSDERDELFDEAARLVVRHQQGSVSLIQRRLKVGYSRAARIVDELETAGIVGPFDGSKARAVLLESEAELEAYL